MSLSTVLFFFLAHLGVGIAFTLAFVHREAGVKFFRFNGGLAAILLVIALAFRFQANAGLTRSDMALVASAAITVFYWATIGRMWAGIRPLLRHRCQKPKLPGRWRGLRLDERCACSLPVACECRSGRRFLTGHCGSAGGP